MDFSKFFFTVNDCLGAIFEVGLFILLRPLFNLVLRLFRIINQILFQLLNLFGIKVFFEFVEHYFSVFGILWSLILNLTDKLVNKLIYLTLSPDFLESLLDGRFKKWWSMRQLIGFWSFQIALFNIQVVQVRDFSLRTRCCHLGILRGRVLYLHACLSPAAQPGIELLEESNFAFPRIQLFLYNFLHRRLSDFLASRF